MKKLLITLFTLVLTTSVIAQEVYETYSLGNISVVTKAGKSQGNVYLDLKEDGTLGLTLKPKQVAKFVEFLTKANDKFNEWTKVAKENDVKELRKDYDKVYLPAYFRYGKWQFGIATLSATFTIKDGSTMGYIYIGSFEASSNQFIKSKSHLFRVNDDLVSEIKNYLSQDKIDKFVKDKSSADELFKN